MICDFEIEELIEPLLRWFPAHARVLPWREDASPYRVWVSEIMLQQTRVEAVKPYFERFIRELPDVKALAECPEDKLLKLWEGLGYYNRVRNMQKAAITVMEEYGGELPTDYEELLKLKGIGNYTAGAVASIAYGLFVPAVDGNVLRVMTRVTADDTDIMKPSFRKEVESALKTAMTDLKLPGQLRKSLKNENVPGALNQALMELGATVCVPNGAPQCEKCPWQQLCLARKEDKIALLPVKSKAKARKIEKRTVLILRDGDKVAICKRPSKGLLAGLYELPNVEGTLTSAEVLALVKKQNFAPIRIHKLAEAKHIFSHIEWHMTGYAVRIEEAEFSGKELNGADILCEDEGTMEHRSGRKAVLKEKGKPDLAADEWKKSLIFVDAEDARERYAIPSAFAAYAEYMNIKLGNERFAENENQIEEMDK